MKQPQPNLERTSPIPPPQINLKEHRKDFEEKLILEGMPQVKYIASRMIGGLPSSTTEEMLETWGTDGLMEATRGYDPESGNKFKTYAEKIIRGRILDNLRKIDSEQGVKRTHRKFINDRIKAEIRLGQKLQREPNEDEIAMEMGLTLEEYRKKIVKYPPEASMLSMGEHAEKNGSNNGNDVLGLERLVDEDSNPNHIPNINKEKMLENLIEVLDIAPLTDTERKVIELFFYKDTTLQDIASELNLHYSRISQLKNTALEKISKLLKNRGYSPSANKKRSEQAKEVVTQLDPWDLLNNQLIDIIEKRGQEVEKVDLKITQRERYILRAIHSEMTNKEMAEIFKVSEKELEKEIKQLGKKVGAENRHDMLIEAARKGALKMNDIKS